MLRSIELNTVGMTNTIYLDLLCRATEGCLSIKELALRGNKMTKHLYK